MGEFRFPRFDRYDQEYGRFEVRDDIFFMMIFVGKN
jgi:hypothetical protein